MAARSLHPLAGTRWNHHVESLVGSSAVLESDVTADARYDGVIRAGGGESLGRFNTSRLVKNLTRG